VPASDRQQISAHLKASRRWYLYGVVVVHRLCRPKSMNCKSCSGSHASSLGDHLADRLEFCGLPCIWLDRCLVVLHPAPLDSAQTMLGSHAPPLQQYAIACCWTVSTSWLEMATSVSLVRGQNVHFGSHWLQRCYRSPLGPYVMLYLSHHEATGMSATLLQRTLCALHTARQTANLCSRSPCAPHDLTRSSASFKAAL
jgi:hypothetical protein